MVALLDCLDLINNVTDEEPVTQSRANLILKETFYIFWNVSFQFVFELLFYSCSFVLVRVSISLAFRYVRR